MPAVAGSVAELLHLLDGLARVHDGAVEIEDEAAFRDRGIRDLAWTATFSDDQSTVDAARWMVWEASQALGARSASIHDLYLARGRRRGPRLYGAGRQHPRTDLRHGARGL